MDASTYRSNAFLHAPWEGAIPDAFPTRLVLKVELVSALPIDGSDNFLVTVSRVDGGHLTMQLTRREAAELMSLIIAERHSGPPALRFDAS